MNRNILVSTPFSLVIKLLMRTLFKPVFIFSNTYKSGRLKNKT